MSIPKINLMVLDLSHYDTITNWQALRKTGIVGIIHKSTQGSTYKDPTYWKHKLPALAAGLLWGSYHFIDDTDVEAQVQNYLSNTAPVTNELIALDFERNASKTAALAQAQEFIQRVEEHLGRIDECVLYSGDLIKETLGNAINAFWSEHRLWLAHYSAQPVIPRQWGGQGPWLWQYSGDGAGPQPHMQDEAKRYMDCNSFDRAPSDLVIEWASGRKSVVPKPAPTVPAPPVPAVPHLATVYITIESIPGVDVQVIQRKASTPGGKS